MKYQHFILAALLLTGTTGCNSNSKPEETKDATPEVTVTNDSTTVEQAAQASQAAQEEQTEATKKEIEAKKAFLEKFYQGLDEDFEPEYVRKFITPKAKKILNDNFEYDCESGDCLAIWLFSYEGGGDTGVQLSQTIEPQDENTFLVTNTYEGEVYKVLLTVVKQGDTYKIDDIKKQ